jgi:hypothetical protein
VPQSWLQRQSSLAGSFHLQADTLNHALSTTHLLRVFQLKPTLKQTSQPTLTRGATSPKTRHSWLRQQSFSWLVPSSQADTLNHVPSTTHLLSCSSPIGTDTETDPTNRHLIQRRHVTKTRSHSCFLRRTKVSSWLLLISGGKQKPGHILLLFSCPVSNAFDTETDPTTDTD